MACSSFSDCINDPIKDNGLDPQGWYTDLSSASVFSINMALFIFYALLIVSVVWFIFKGIYTLIGADSADSYEKFRGAITNAVFAAIGIVLIGGARYIFVVALRLLGIPNAENLFMDGTIQTLFGI